jgi:signal transduction histidine kinase
MTPVGYLLLGLTALVAVVVGAATFAVLRFAAAARDTRRHLRDSGAHAAVLSHALQDAVSKLKAQAAATSVRAEASERLSGRIVESLTAGLLVVDAAGTTEIVNPAGRRMLGLEGDPVGARFRDLLSGAPALASVIDECLTTARPVVRRSIELAVADRSSHFGVTVSPIGGPDNPRGAICLFSDLTAVVELEEQLRLKEALARLGELTGGIAHEFRNGLATIQGYSRLIDPQQLPEAYRPYVAAIREETEALGRVVTNFLNFARPDQVVFNPVAMPALAAECADEARADFPHADITVRGAFTTIEGDQVLLRRMLSNLIRNGVDACEGAGARPVVVVEGHVDRQAGACRIEVHDGGPGIDPSIRERVFLPFFTTRKQGIGLGLAIVQKVVVTHNGRIAVGASPLGGARFEVTFPLPGTAPVAQGTRNLP